jgi:hypothetical protein
MTLVQACKAKRDPRYSLLLNVYIFEYLEYSRWGNGNENGDREEEH